LRVRRLAGLVLVLGGCGALAFTTAASGHLPRRLAPPQTLHVPHLVIPHVPHLVIPHVPRLPTPPVRAHGTTCFVAGGSVCARRPCRVYTVLRSPTVVTIVGRRSLPTTPSLPRVGRDCTFGPAFAQPVLVSSAVAVAQRR
jgi:hypothetical protein